MQPIEVHGIKSANVRTLSYPISVSDSMCTPPSPFPLPFPFYSFNFKTILEEKYAEVIVNETISKNKAFSLTFSHDNNLPLLETADLQMTKYRHALSLPIGIYFLGLLSFFFLVTNVAWVEFQYFAKNQF